METAPNISLKPKFGLQDSHWLWLTAFWMNSAHVQVLSLLILAHTNVTFIKLNFSNFKLYVIPFALLYFHQTLVNHQQILSQWTPLKHSLRLEILSNGLVPSQIHHCLSIPCSLESSPSPFPFERETFSSTPSPQYLFRFPSRYLELFVAAFSFRPRSAVVPRIEKSVFTGTGLWKSSYSGST